MLCRLLAECKSSGRGVPTARRKDAAALPGARVIRERYAFVGADPSVYAFFRIATQQNIYRVRVH